MTPARKAAIEIFNLLYLPVALVIGALILPIAWVQGYRLPTRSSHKDATRTIVNRNGVFMWEEPVDDVFVVRRPINTLVVLEETEDSISLCWGNRRPKDE